MGEHILEGSGFCHSTWSLIFDQHRNGGFTTSWPNESEGFFVSCSYAVNLLAVTKQFNPRYMSCIGDGLAYVHGSQHVFFAQ